MLIHIDSNGAVVRAMVLVTASLKALLAKVH